MTEAIRGVFAGRRCMGFCGRSRSDEPEAEMLQNGFDDLPILDEVEDLPVFTVLPRIDRAVDLRTHRPGPRQGP